MQQPLPRGCVKLCEIQVIAATAVGATISWLRQYLKRILGRHTLEAVIFLEGILSVFECFFLVMNTHFMRIWLFNRNLFVLFSHSKLKSCMYISSNSHTHSSSKNTAWYIKTFKILPWWSYLLPSFWPTGIWLPPISLLGQVSGRYRGFTASWLWVAYYWKSEGGGWVGCWTKKCWLEPRRNPRIHGERWFPWRGTMIGSNLIVSRWNYTLQYKQRDVSTGKQKQNNKERQFTMWPFLGSTMLSFKIHPYKQPTPFFGWETFFSSSKRCPNGSTPSLSADRFDQLGASMAVGDANWA